MNLEQYLALPWYKRLFWNMFPGRVLPAHVEGAFYIQTVLDTRMGWRDRMRVLFTGHTVTVVRVRTTEKTEPTEVEFAQWVLPPGAKV